MTNDPSASARRNATVQPVNLTPSASSSKTYRNLQHQHRAQGRNQEEQTPDPGALKMFDFNKGRTTVNQIPVDSRPASAAITTNSQPVPVTTDSTVPAKMPSQVSMGLGSVPPAPGSNAGPEQQSLCNRTNSQPIVEALSLNQSESRTTTNNEHAVQAEDIIAPPDMSAPPAPVATMVGSTDGSLTRNNPMEVSDTQAVDPAHIFARTQGDGLRICPSGITCRRWLEGSKCPYGPACQYQHHYCARSKQRDQVHVSIG